MSLFTRREAAGIAVTAACFAPRLLGQRRINSTFSGVVVGAQCYSFRDRPLDAAIEAMTDIGIGECEMNWAHLEPIELRRDRERLRHWRLTVPLAGYESAGTQVRAAGIDPWAYTYNIKSDFTEPEMVRGFEMALALGAQVIVCSANVSAVKRIDGLAKKYKVRVALHNHSRIVPDEIATPDDFDAATKGGSDYLGFALDIGHFVAAGFNPIEFLRKHASRTLNIHVKDRKREQGPNVPLGEGDTPVKEVLRFIRDGKHDIKANIEYEYKGQDTLTEVRKCFKFCRDALLT